MPTVSESVYARLPVWAQNAALSAWGLRYRRRRLGGCFRTEAQGFRERERWAAERMRGFVTARLRRVLLRAFQETDYYRERWRAAGVEAGDLERFEPEDLPRLPELRRDDLRREAARLIVRGARPESLRRVSTSGSTGTPVSVYWTDPEWQRMTAAREARSLGWAGGTLLGSRAMIGGRDVTPGANPGPPYYRYNRAERQVYFTAFHIRPSTLESYVEGFRRHRPRLLTGYAHSYFFLARMMLEQGVELGYRPEAIVLGSEALTDEMRRAVEEAFGRRPFEEYGSVEGCVLATECERGSLHLNVDVGWVEILDELGRPAPAGQSGRIVCTGLGAETQPLIRYGIGDAGGFAAGTCPCGRAGLPVMLPIEGRIEDVVYGPDGRRAVRLDWIFKDCAEILEAQIVQERADLFRVKAVTSGGLTPELAATLSARLRARMGEVVVEVERVAAIPRGARGKFKAVSSLLSPEEKERLRGLGKSHSGR